MSHKQSVEKRTDALKTCNFGHVLPLGQSQFDPVGRAINTATEAPGVDKGLQ
jgi:hypothetical protein